MPKPINSVHTHSIDKVLPFPGRISSSICNKQVYICLIIACPIAEDFCQPKLLNVCIPRTSMCRYLLYVTPVYINNKYKRKKNKGKH
jgi:hypothetical protein